MKGDRMRKKRKKRQYVILLFVYLVLIVCGVFGGAAYYVKQTKNKYEKKLTETYNLIRQNTRQVYVAVRDIKVGELIREDMLEVRRILCSQDEELLFSIEDIGKEAVADIQAGTFLNKTFVNQSGIVDGLREICYRSIDLTENVCNLDVVDIRIRYPDGADYIILSGKRILLEEGMPVGSCCLRVNEEELLLMSAALVDAERNDGAQIYTSRYPEPAIQKKSVVTYCPPEGIADLIQESPNIADEVSIR